MAKTTSAYGTVARLVWWPHMAGGRNLSAWSGGCSMTTILLQRRLCGGGCSLLGCDQVLVVVCVHFLCFKFARVCDVVDFRV